MALALGDAAAIRTAARALLEGTPASLDLVAQLTGRSIGYLTRTAEKEGWRIAEAGHQDGALLEQRLMDLASGMVDEMEGLVFSTLAGHYDKQRIDALGSMLKIIEKLGEVVHMPHYSAQKEEKDDAELAAALALVDARIVELARELAATMGGEEPLTCHGGADTG